MRPAPWSCHPTRPERVRQGKPLPLAPGSWLAVLGGGQLGRMFCMAAQSMGYRVCVLDPAADSPAGAVADRHLCANYDDPAALADIARTCAAATTEFENVPAQALLALAEHMHVAPSAQAVAIAQDRVAEKTFLQAAGLPVGEYAVIRTAADLATAPAHLFPGILKLARLGYDGKGQIAIANQQEGGAAWAHLTAGSPALACVLERRLNLACEVSVMIARGHDAAMVTWPIARNVHRNGILATSTVPAAIDPAIERAAIEMARQIAQALQYVGVLGVECFVLPDGSLRINEIAPRPHNSGHWTLDAALTSQFEQQVRTLAGLPLGATTLLAPAVMLNILGDSWYDRGDPPPPSDAALTTALVSEPDWVAVLSHPNAKLHLYGKAQPRLGRKMGHVTALGTVATDPAQTIQDIARVLHAPI